MPQEPGNEQIVTSQLLTLGICLFLLGVLVRMIRGRASVTTFSYRRAQSSVRSSTGTNAAGMFAVVELSQLVLNLDKLTSGKSPAPLVSAVLVLTVLAFIVALAIAGRRAAVLLSIAGVGTGTANVYIDHGPNGVVLLLVVAALIFWIFGFSHGTLRPR